MKSESYSASEPAQRFGIPELSALAIFLIMELPVRLLLQPDPWLLKSEHWYFEQPLRLAIELTLVMILISSLKWIYPSTLSLQRNQYTLVLWCMLGSAILFGVLESDQLINSFASGLPLWLIWFLTGFCIGIGQELLYRGLLFTSLSRYMSVSLASIITTFLFIAAPLHSIRLWQYVQQEHYNVVFLLIAIYCAASVFFQWLRNYTGSVTAPALVHGVGNAITWVAVFAVV